MLLRSPYTGAVIDAADGAVEVYKAHGFVAVDKPQTERVEAESKPKPKKAAKKG